MRPQVPVVVTLLLILFRNDQFLVDVIILFFAQSEISDGRVNGPLHKICDPKGQNCYAFGTNHEQSKMIRRHLGLKRTNLLLLLPNLFTHNIPIHFLNINALILLHLGRRLQTFRVHKIPN